MSQRSPRNPLDWELPYSEPPDQADTDIKWLYHLCEHSDKVKDGLASKDGPRQLPYPVTGQQTSADRAVRPNKCMGCQFPLMEESS